MISILENDSVHIHGSRPWNYSQNILMSLQSLFQRFWISFANRRTMHSILQNDVSRVQVSSVLSKIGPQR